MISPSCVDERNMSDDFGAAASRATSMQISCVEEAPARRLGVGLFARPGAKKCLAACCGIRQRLPDRQFACGKDARGELGKTFVVTIEPIRGFEIDAYLETTGYRKHRPTCRVRYAKVDGGTMLACDGKGRLAALTILEDELRRLLVQRGAQQAAQETTGGDVTLPIALEMETCRPRVFRGIEMRA